MADHGEVQYATADGNDLPAHEAGYLAFVQLCFVASFGVASIVMGLAIGGVHGHWLIAGAIIILSAIVSLYGLWSGSRAPSFVLAVLAALALLYSSYS
jgi:hypothetical protein